MESNMERNEYLDMASDYLHDIRYNDEEGEYLSRAHDCVTEPMDDIDIVMYFKRCIKSNAITFDDVVEHGINDYNSNQNHSNELVGQILSDIIVEDDSDPIRVYLGRTLVSMMDEAFMADQDFKYVAGMVACYDSKTYDRVIKELGSIALEARNNRMQPPPA